MITNEKMDPERQPKISDTSNPGDLFSHGLIRSATNHDQPVTIYERCQNINLGSRGETPNLGGQMKARSVTRCDGLWGPLERRSSLDA
jgi:hypothetical protein